MKTCFSEEQLTTQFGNPAILSEPPFQLTPPPPPISEHFFMTSLFVQILKTRNPLILGGGNYDTTHMLIISDLMIYFVEDHFHILKL